MRIIGGKWKGRRIQLPSKNWPVRPTTDFAREALFNILDNRLDYEYIRALDLFGGTGIHCFELASRGCNDITYVDIYRDSVKFMKQMSKEWDMPVNAVQSDVMTFLNNCRQQWDYIFADPPYDLKGIEDFPEKLINSNLLKENGFIVLEHRSSLRFENMPGFIEARHYGQTVFTFFGGGS